MAGPKISGLAVAEAIAGFVLFWSGLKGQTLTVTVKDLLKGQNPPKQAEAAPQLGVGASDAGSATGSPGPGTAIAPPAPASLSANQSTAKLMAAAYGWTGSQWNALYSLWTRESGFNNLIANPSSGAFGIAQALGHGTAGSAVTVPVVYYPGGGSARNVLVNEYPSAAANGGSAGAQIAWGLSYVKGRYGNPEAAWAHEESAGWY